jgi:hypothetical protein
MKQAQKMICTTCGKEFEFGLDEYSQPLNCETNTMMNRLEIYCPHCEEEYYFYNSGTGKNIIKKDGGMGYAKKI